MMLRAGFVTLILSITAIVGNIDESSAGVTLIMHREQANGATEMPKLACLRAVESVGSRPGEYQVLVTGRLRGPRLRTPVFTEKHPPGINQSILGIKLELRRNGEALARYLKAERYPGQFQMVQVFYRSQSIGRTKVKNVKSPLC